jgi:tetratricopeptide (TPR) repeat protein
MNESDYIDSLEALFPEEDEASVEALNLAEAAVAAYPSSTKLWCLRGDLIQLGTSEAGYELEDALRSYERALTVDPHCAEAYESIGYFYDALMDDPQSAEPSFRKAISLGAGVDSYCGLARVLAELDRSEEALRLLSPENCPYHNEDEIVEIKEEIASGMWSPEPRA